ASVVGTISIGLLAAGVLLPSSQWHPSPVVGHRPRLRGARCRTHRLADTHRLGGSQPLHLGARHGGRARMGSPLGQGTRLGASGYGVGPWWVQRLTALALIPLSVWFMASLVMIAQSPDPFRVADWMAAPSHAIGAGLLLVAMFWHAKLGLQVVIEDYVHCHAG